MFYKSKVDNYFSAISSTYNFRYKFLWAKWQMEKIFELADSLNISGNILDFGTGTGIVSFLLAKRFPNAKIVSTDISKGMLKTASKLAQKNHVITIEFVKMDTEKLAFPKNFFSLAVSNSSFHHVKNKKKALKLIMKSLKKNSLLVISDWFVPKKEYEEKHSKMFSKAEILKFNRSFSKYLKKSEKILSKHPKEYAICQTELKNLLVDAGFKDVKIIQSPHKNFAVLVAKK